MISGWVRGIYVLVLKDNKGGWDVCVYYNRNTLIPAVFLYDSFFVMLRGMAFFNKLINFCEANILEILTEPCCVNNRRMLTLFRVTSSPLSLFNKWINSNGDYFSQNHFSIYKNSPVSWPLQDFCEQTKDTSD